MKEKIVSYIVATVIGLIIGLGVLYVYEFDFSELKHGVVIVSNAFFVPAILYIGFGTLTYVAKNNVFDMLGYAFKSLYNLTFGRKVERYYDYKLRIHEKDDEKDKNYLLIVGFVFLAISLILLAIADMILKMK